MRITISDFFCKSQFFFSPFVEQMTSCPDNFSGRDEFQNHIDSWYVFEIRKRCSFISLALFFLTIKNSAYNDVIEIFFNSLNLFCWVVLFVLLLLHFHRNNWSLSLNHKKRVPKVQVLHSSGNALFWLRIFCFSKQVYTRAFMFVVMFFAAIVWIIFYSLRLGLNQSISNQGIAVK